MKMNSMMEIADKREFQAKFEVGTNSFYIVKFSRINEPGYGSGAFVNYDFVVTHRGESWHRTGIQIVTNSGKDGKTTFILFDRYNKNINYSRCRDGFMHLNKIVLDFMREAARMTDEELKDDKIH